MDIKTKVVAAPVGNIVSGAPPAANTSAQTAAAAASGGAGSGGTGPVLPELMCSLFGLVLDTQTVKQLLLTLENAIANDTDWEWDANQYRKAQRTAAEKQFAAASAISAAASPGLGGVSLPTKPVAPPPPRPASEDVVNAKELLHYERVYSSDFKDASGSELRAWTHVSRQTHCDQWHVQSVGRPTGGAQKYDCVVRSVKVVKVDGTNYHSFLGLLGYRLEYEFVQKGWIFHADGGDIEIRIYQLHKFGKPADLTSLHRLAPPPATAAAIVTASGAAPGSAAAAAAHANLVQASSGRWVVELRALCSDDRLMYTQQRLIAFGKTLHPIIKFSKGEV